MTEASTVTLNSTPSSTLSAISQMSPELQLKIVSLLKEKTALLQQVDSKNTTINSLTDRVRAEDAKNAKLNEQLVAQRILSAQQRQQFETQSTSLQSLRSENHSLRSENHRISTHSSDLQDKFNTLSSTHESEKQRLQTENEQTIATAQSAIQSVRSERADEFAALQRTMQTQQTTMTSQAAEIAAKNRNIAILHDLPTQLTQQIQKLERDKQEIEQAKRAAEQANEASKAQVQTKDQTIAFLRDLFVGFTVAVGALLLFTVAVSHFVFAVHLTAPLMVLGIILGAILIIAPLAYKHYGSSLFHFKVFA